MVDVLSILFIYFLKRFYSFIWERARVSKHKQGEQQEREKQTPSLIWGSIPGSWDHDLSWRQPFNRLSHPGAPGRIPFQYSLICSTDQDLMGPWTHTSPSLPSSTHNQYIHSFCIRVSQPLHYWHFEPDNSFLWGAVLCVLGCLVAPWPLSTHLSVIIAKHGVVGNPLWQPPVSNSSLILRARKLKPGERKWLKWGMGPVHG